MYDYIVVHYNEIALKGANRPKFEKALVSNLRYILKSACCSEIKRIYGRILVKLDKCSQEEMSKIKEQLSHCFGIAHYSFAHSEKLDIQKISEKALELSKSFAKGIFHIKTTRSNKNFPLTSLQVNEKVGSYVSEKAKLKVSFEKSDVIFIELTEKCALIYTEKIQGLGGLPVGVTAKVVSSLSGGIDSPVASWLMMKRGCSVILVHFYNRTINTEASLEKIRELAKILSCYQFKTTLYLVPFYELQREIIKKIPARLRMIVYRRFMMKLLEKIAQSTGAKAIVTGDNLAQVASQTMENLSVIHKAAALPILAPLIANDKNETIQLARKIGTYETSIQPYEDCCSYFIAEHPETRSSIEQIAKAEKEINLNISPVISSALKNADILVLRQSRKEN